MRDGAPRAVLAGLWVIPLTLVVATLILLTSVIPPRGRWMMPLGRLWSRWLLRVAGVKVRFEGLEHLRGVPVALFMANHQSMLDIPAVALAMPDSLRFIAKRELAWLPFFGWSMVVSGGCIFIDRGHHERAVASLRRAARRIRSGHCVLVFPEGTRSRDGRLEAFKKGPFHLATQALVPIIPVAITGTRELMPRGALSIHAGQVVVRFGPPLEPGTSTPAELSARVHSALAALLAQ